MSAVEGSEPVSEHMDVVPSGLTSPLTVALATLLCGPVSGFWLLSSNDAVLRRRADGWGMAAAGAVWVILSQASIPALKLFLPPEEQSSVATTLSWGLSLGCVVVVMGLVYFLHGGAYREQQFQGNPGAARGDTIKRVLFGWFIYLGISLGV